MATFAATVKVTFVGLSSPSRGIAVIDTLWLPYGVEAGMTIVSMLLFPVTFGMILFGLNEQDAPRGRVTSTQESVTLEGVPASKVAVTLVEPDLPGRSVIPPAFDSE